MYTRPSAKRQTARWSDRVSQSPNPDNPSLPQSFSECSQEWARSHLVIPLRRSTDDPQRAMRRMRVLLWSTTQIRACANRSWSVIRSALPTVVSPCFSDEPPHDDVSRGDSPGQPSLREGSHKLGISSSGSRLGAGVTKTPATPLSRRCMTESCPLASL
jgi:hypothetical protein